MSRSRNETQFVTNTVAGVDEIHEPRSSNRAYRVIEHGGACGGAVIFRPIELDTPDQVACSIKGRHPATTDQFRVPAYVIGVQMGAQHGVDRVGRASGRGKVLKKRTLAAVPRWKSPALLVIANARIDDDASGRCFHQQ